MHVIPNEYEKEVPYIFKERTQDYVTVELFIAIIKSEPPIGM